jgi:autotransporter-associated beta strand protein
MAGVVSLNGGLYQLGGGLLELSGGLQTAGGTLDCGGGPATIQAASSIVDLTGSVLNTASTSLFADANSLVIVPPGFNPLAAFSLYSNLGITHTAGTTLTVSATQGFGGAGTITDPVNCQGTINASPGGAINLTNGLLLSGAGQVNLGLGTLTVNDTASGISGGALSADALYVGSSGTGSFTQSGGTNSLTHYLYLGNNPGDSGTYTLTGNALLAAPSGEFEEFVGYSGSGSFTQSGGTHAMSGYLFLGYNSGSFGTYNLSGSGLLSAPAYEYVGYSGSGSFTQSGGTNSISYGDLYLATNPGSSGTYRLSGGLLSGPSYEYIGYSGSGCFTQSGGTNSVSSYLYLGGIAGGAGGNGTYTLTSGLLSAQSEYAGLSGSGAFTQSGGTNATTNLYLTGANGTYSLSGSGLLSVTSLEQIQGPQSPFQQTGGTNAAACVNLSGGYYLLGGGLLQVNGGLATAGGTLDGGGGTATIQAANSIVDLTGSVVNTASTSLAVGGNSLLIVPPGFNPATAFQSYSNLGLTHVLGTTLTVSAGTGFGGWGTITDPVVCQGTILATAGGAVNLTNGLLLSGTAQVNLGLGTLTVNDSASGISGGSLLSATMYVGSSGTGTFTQSGGSNSPSTLYLGNNFGDSGTYDLSGNGLLSTSYEYVGYSGSGSFAQSGGTHAVSGYLYLGSSAGAPGTYSLGGSGLLSTAVEYLGYDGGTGSFTQTGGTHAVTNLYLGTYDGSGTYNLSGSGLLSAGTEFLGYYYGNGAFTQTGGTHAVATLYIGEYGFGNEGGGTYSLSGSGLLSAGTEYLGYDYGTGAFIQTGGTHAVSDLYLGTYGGSGTYSLSGSGLLTATSEQIQDATSLFQQTAGTNAAAFVNLSGGRYLLGGGLLQINGGLATAGGTLDCGGGSAAIQAANSIVDLTGSIVNAASTSLAVGPNSLVMVPAGFNPAAAFQSYSNLGLTHLLGTTLTVSAGTGFGGWGTIPDPVVCQGTILATPSGAINLGNGLLLSGTGQVNLGLGTLTVNDSASGMTGGMLVAGSLVVGPSGAGTFTQSGGTNAAGNIVLGSNAASAGTYNLNGGLLSLSGLTQGAGSAALNFNGGTFQAAGSFSTSVPILLGTPGSNGTFDAGGNTVTLYGPLSGPGGLLKTGPGALYLSGSNSYAGPTVLDAGMLVADSGLAISAASSGTVTLNGGTLAAGPDGGTIAGPVVAGSGPHTIAPGAGSYLGYGTLNLNGGLTTNADTTLAFNFDLGTVLGTDVHSNNIYGGDLINLNGSALNFSGGSIVFGGGSSPALAGDYRLFAGYSSATVPAFGLPVAPGGETYALSASVDSGYLDLVVSGTAAASGGTWVHAGSGSWAIGGNWSSAPTPPSSGTVTFPEVGLPVTITLDGPQSAGALVFSSSDGYVLAPGSGGTLTLGTAAGGSIAVLAGTHVISAPLVLAGSADVAPVAGTQLTIFGNISETGGSQSLTLSDAGTLVLSGTNSFSGGTTVTAGTLVLADPAALADGSSLTVGQGAAAIFAAAPSPSAAAPLVDSPGAAAAAVPEPGTLVLLIAALVVGFGLFRTRLEMGRLESRL